MEPSVEPLSPGEIRIKKPQELLDCFDLAEEIFLALKQAMPVDSYVLDLSSIDAAAETITQETDVVAYAMRKAQGLRHLATSGKRTSNDVVVTIIAELTRVLEEIAPKLPEENGDRLLDIRDKVVQAGRTVCSIASPEADVVILI